MVSISRLIKHISTPRFLVRRYFPTASLQAIEQTITESEKTHGGQICFIVEPHLPFGRLLRDLDARSRALEIFSELRVWDTEQNSGVLIYLLLADHNIEIIADRGARKVISEQQWENVCRAMEKNLAGGEFVAGIVNGITQIGELLKQHFHPGNTDELPNKPRIL